MKFRATLIWLVFISLVGGAPSRAGPPGEAGFVLEWDGPPYRLTAVPGADGQTFTRVEVADADYIAGGPPGWPSLPRRGQLVALPPNGDFGLEILAVSYDTVALDHPLEAAPGPLYTDADTAAAPPVVAGDAPYPAQFVELGKAVWMRESRLARLTFTPFRYHPDRQTLDVLRHIRFRVWWEQVDNQPANRPIHPPTTTQSPTHKILVETEGLYALDRATLADAGLPVASIDPSTLRLFHAGREVAAQWEGDTDTTFESGERLLFYARPQFTRYAGYDVYRLEWGQATGARMAVRDGDPTGLPAGPAWTTALLEENAAYLSPYQGRDGDRWFWQQLKLPDLTGASFSLALDTPDDAHDASLTVWLQGTTASPPDPDHHITFSVNGTAVGEVWWEGQTPYTATLNVPAGLLQAGDNTVALTLPGDTGSAIEGAWVDAIAVEYALTAVGGDATRLRGADTPGAYTVGGFTGNVRVYDVTDPDAPQVVTGFTTDGETVALGDHGRTPADYWLLADAQIQSPNAIVPTKTLVEPPDGADYLILTHPDFAAALAPLADHRASQGLRVSVIDVEAVYDQFGDGRMDPEAIHAFLDHAYTNWPGPPLTYVLLVGDGTYDPRGYKSDSNPTYLPPYLADVDPWLGETGSDNRYADLSGDPLPELRVGRLPVNSAAQVTALVDKIIAYETNPQPGLWNARLLFGADNPSTAGDHHKDADAEYLTFATPAYGYTGTRVYLSETGGAPHLYTDAEAAQDALIAALNDGALLYTYFGHASWHQEAVLETDGWAPLFHQDHIARLTNTGRWPVVLHMTCFTGRYFEPVGDTLDESLLRADSVGAVAVWGSSGNGVATGHSYLHRGFYQSVFDNGESELGAATHAALSSLYATGLHTDLIETYHLFGDPAMRLDLTVVDWPFSVFMPIIAHSSR